MARELKDVRLILSSADQDTVYDANGLRAEYCVCDAELTAQKHVTVTGINLSQPLSDIWADIIAQLNTNEGI